jgi:hypothetical protein
LGADYAAAGPEIKKRLREREAGGKDTYLFKILKDALGQDSDEVADILAKPLYDILFPGGKFAAMGDQKTQLGKLQNAIAANLPKVVEQLQQSEEYGEKLKNVKGLMSSAKHGYTARIVRDFMSNVLEFIESESDGEEVPTEQEVHTAVAKAAKKTAAEATPKADAAAETPSEAPAGPNAKYIEAAKVKAGSSDGGILERELIDEIAQMYVTDNPDMARRSAEARATGIVRGLLNQKILAKQGGYITLSEEGDLEDKETGGVGLDPEEYLARYQGEGPLARATTGRSLWGNKFD